MSSIIHTAEIDIGVTLCDCHTLYSAKILAILSTLASIDDAYQQMQTYTFTLYLSAGQVYLRPV